MAAAERGEPGPDYYQLLGVARGASREEIAQAWRRGARAEHPDRRPGEAGEAAARFRALAEAYRVLGDPARRAAYDRALASGQAADGLNLAGIRRVLQPQEETRELQAELARLRRLAGQQPATRQARQPRPRADDRA